MSTAAQDEFDQLMNSARVMASKHPEDRDNKSDASSNKSSRSKDGNGDRGGALRSGVNRVTDEDDLEAIQKATNDNMRLRYHLPTMQRNANTGPKGVIADAYAFENARKAAQSQANLALSNGAGNSSHLGTGHTSNVAISDEENDDGFLSSWRARRMREMDESSRFGKLGNDSGHGGVPGRYGSVATVDADGYLDAVEKSPRGVQVVVFIYDDASEVSALLEALLRNIARSLSHTRFIRLHYEEAEFEPAGVPAVIAYKDGDKYGSIVPLIDEMPDDAPVDASTLLTVLERHHIL